jgi:DNA replication and repair protein RecF
VRLDWIELRDFRSYREASLRISPGLTAVVGPNGEGKTNLLEALYYLVALESPRVSSDLPLVRIAPGTIGGSAFLRGEAESGSGRFLIEVEIRAGGANRLQVNRSAVRRKRDLRRHLRAVFSGPDDLDVVQGEPDHRRRFMDEVVRTLWPAKEGLASAYERALRQRNRLLKDWSGTGEPAGLQGWDAELVTHGSALAAVRRQAVEAIEERAEEEFRAISDRGQGALVVGYRPSVEADAADLPRAFREALTVRRADELIRRTTLVGPHRDELALRVEGLVARGFASHGEAWAAAVSLRLALARAVAEETGELPTVFLDDPFSALDPVRRRRLAEGLHGRGQLLIAIPDEQQLPDGAAVWRVRDGSVLTGEGTT